MKVFRKEYIILAFLMAFRVSFTVHFWMSLLQLWRLDFRWIYEPNRHQPPSYVRNFVWNDAVLANEFAFLVTSGLGGRMLSCVHGYGLHSYSSGHSSAPSFSNGEWCLAHPLKTAAERLPIRYIFITVSNFCGIESFKNLIFRRQERSLKPKG
jgi:hypothetical protein